MRKEKKMTDDRGQNAEVGMRNAESFDFGFQISDLSDFHHATRNPQRATRNSDQKPVTSNK